MKLTFIPAPGSPWRVISADDPQPEEAWSPHAVDKRVAPVLAPTQADVPPLTAEHPTPAPPCPSANDPSQPTPVAAAAADDSEFLEPLPRGVCSNCSDRPLLIEARRQANYYRTKLHEAKSREAQKDAHIAELEAEVRKFKQRLYGSKSEVRHTPDQPRTPTHQDPLAEDASPGAATPGSAPAPKSPRKRGQQKGNPIPKRRDYSHLPVLTEEHVLPQEQARCPCCDKPFSPAGYEEDTEIIEIEVKAYRRRIRRKRYFRTCSCPDRPTVVAAPVVPRLLQRSPFGISLWVQILLDKYEYCRSTHKLLDDLRSHGLDLAPGTVNGGLKSLAGLFEPLYEKLKERSRQQAWWHADETRWPVFQVVTDKVGNRWYIWLFESGDCVVFTLDKGRAHDVPDAHFGQKARGIVVVDRYSAYKAMKLVKEGQLLLAFCWAHQRRDFLEVEKSWPQLSEWAVGWVQGIGHLYHLNKERLAAKEKSPDRQEKDKRLREAVAGMRRQWEEELKDKRLHPAKKQTLSSLKEHWAGLTLFVDNPHVPMDNNSGERTLRIAALGRKNYYGSGAEWSGKLTAWMFSLLATLKKWRINRRKWLRAYLEACAVAGGKVPEDVERWLPWNLTVEQRKEMAQTEEEEKESSQQDQQPESAK